MKAFTISRWFPDPEACCLNPRLYSDDPTVDMFASPAVMDPKVVGSLQVLGIPNYPGFTPGGHITKHTWWTLSDVLWRILEKSMRILLGE